MARTRSRRDLTVSLFPFLSVLACVIGTLTLIIAALAVRQVASELNQETDVQEPHEVLLAREREIAAIEARFAASLEARDELLAARAALSRLGVRPEESEAQRRRSVESRVRAVQLSARLSALRREQKELGSTIQLENAELEALRRPRDPSLITIQPRGTGAALKPFFVECDASRLRIHKPGESWTIDLALDDQADLSRFDVFLRGVRSTADGTLIFLIRPEGVETYIRAVPRANRLYVRHGKLPLPGRGRIDFSLF